MSASEFLQSKYFRPCLNTAIFDGPVRFYFAQNQESEAMKLYFKLRQELKEIWNRPAHSLPTIFLVQYPSDQESTIAGLEGEFARFDLETGFVLAFRSDEEPSFFNNTGESSPLGKMKDILFSFERSELAGLQSF